MQNIEYDKKVYALRKQDDVVSKLEQVKQYITSQGVIDAKKGTVKDTTFASHTVIELEEALFSIIDELSRLETLVSGTSIKTESHPDSGVSTADDKSHEVPPLPESGATSVVTVPRDSVRVSFLVACVAILTVIASFAHIDHFLPICLVCRWIRYRQHKDHCSSSRSS